MITFEIPSWYGATIGVVAHPPLDEQGCWTCDISIDGELLRRDIPCEHNVLWKTLQDVPAHRGRVILEIFGRIQEVAYP